MEYMRELVFGDPDATVPDFNANIVAGSPASKQNSSSVSVSDRIRQQVADHLREHAPVAADDELGTDDAQSEPSFLHKGDEVSSERLQDFVQRKIAHRRAPGARFLRQVCVPRRLGGAAQALPAGISGSAMAVASHGLQRPESSIWRDRPFLLFSPRAKASRQ